MAAIMSGNSVACSQRRSCTARSGAVVICASQWFPAIVKVAAIAVECLRIGGLDHSGAVDRHSAMVLDNCRAQAGDFAALPALVRKHLLSLRSLPAGHLPVQSVSILKTLGLLRVVRI
jgi:hypothetical protein